MLSCSGSAQPPAERSVSFQHGTIPHAVEAWLPIRAGDPVTSIAFTIRSQPGARSRDVHVRYERHHLDRTHAIDEGAGLARVTVFGLYAGYENEVTTEIAYASGETTRAEHRVRTDPPPGDPFSPVLLVDAADPALATNFILLQGHGPATILDVDGAVRWRAPDVGEPVFPQVQVPEGLVAGSLFTSAIYEIDWFGRFASFSMSDPCCFLSHHNIEPGKAGGFLNTVSYKVGDVIRPQSVLAEMSADGDVTKVWNFDELFRTWIRDHGEDPSSLVMDGVDWFHMNSAVYDPSDDGILLSSRENFVAKVDYATGAIRWLLGNPEKLWYTGFPASLQPLALTVHGEPPIGQHALSVSPDGTRVLMFDNGKGNIVLDDIGDSRTHSRVTVYRIDETAGTADEVWAFDLDPSLYSPYCGSAYWTRTGAVLITDSSPVDGSPARFLVVDPSKHVLFEAHLESGQCGYAYRAGEIDLDGMQLR